MPHLRQSTQVEVEVRQLIAPYAAGRAVDSRCPALLHANKQARKRNRSLPEKHDVTNQSVEKIIKHFDTFAASAPYRTFAGGHNRVLVQV